MVAAVLHPQSLDCVTAAWLTAALASKHQGTVVAALRQTGIINGTATKVRFELDYGNGNNPHGLPSSMWLKGGFESHSAATAAGNRNEANFFRDIAHRLNANQPQSFYQSVCAQSGEGLVLLEDLLARKAVFCDLTQALSPEQAAAVLDMQARYHAALWDSSELDDLDWLKKGGFIEENKLIEYFFGLWDAMAQLPRFRHVTAPLRDSRNELKQAVATMLELNKTQARCLVHGDTHMGNLYIDGAGKPGYLDWQAVMRGSWAFDLAPLMVSALSIADRRAHEKALLAHYLDRLAHYGASAPSFDEAWLAYRRFAIWSFMFALCPPEFQREENCSAVAERANAALIDLSTLEALS